MTVFDKLTLAERKELKKGVIEVYGKHMNRTALGIVDAVFTLFPTITFNELKEILPDSINPAAPKNFKSLFKPYTEKLYGVIQPGSIRKEYETEGLDLNASHFISPGETFQTSDGVEVLVSKAWESKDTETGEHDLQKLIDHVSTYGIHVVSFEAKDQPFTKGGYFLKITQPLLLSKITAKSVKKFPWWIIILTVAIATVILYFVLK
jgi:hypothetical protein